MQVTDKLVPDRDVNKPKALTPFATRELKPSGQVRPERYERPQPPDLSKQPDVHQTEKDKPHVYPGQIENQPTTVKPERYERPEPPSQPRHYETTVRPEPRVEQPVQQPRHYETTVRPEPRVEQPVPQPRHIEQPTVHHQQPVPQPGQTPTTVPQQDHHR